VLEEALELGIVSETQRPLLDQLMGSDLGPQWQDGEEKTSKMVFIGLDLPKEIFLQGLEGCLV